MVALLPHLLQKKVLSAEEERELNQLEEGEKAAWLVTMVGSKGMRSIVALVESIRQSQENKKLSNLFDVAPGESLARELAHLLPLSLTFSQENTGQGREDWYIVCSHTF